MEPLILFLQELIFLLQIQAGNICRCFLFSLPQVIPFRHMSYIFFHYKEFLLQVPPEYLLELLQALHSLLLQLLPLLYPLKALFLRLQLILYLFPYTHLLFPLQQ